MDPTGQFWKCHAVVLGRDADRAEEALYQKLVEQRRVGEEDDNKDSSTGSRLLDLGEFLETLDSDEAIRLACDCMETIVCPPTTNNNKQPSSSPRSSVHWKAVTLEYHAKDASSKPRRRTQFGAFLPPKITET
jgi:hypothetical protein